MLSYTDVKKKINKFLRKYTLLGISWEDRDTHNTQWSFPENEVMQEKNGLLPRLAHHPGGFRTWPGPPRAGLSVVSRCMVVLGLSQWFRSKNSSVCSGNGFLLQGRELFVGMSFMLHQVQDQFLVQQVLVEWDLIGEACVSPAKSRSRTCGAKAYSIWE